MHRDLKSANIFIHNDCLKIGDFGFAIQAEEQSLKLGTPLYMVEICNFFLNLFFFKKGT